MAKNNKSMSSKGAFSLLKTFVVILVLGTAFYFSWDRFQAEKPEPIVKAKAPVPVHKLRFAFGIYSKSAIENIEKPMEKVQERFIQNGLDVEVLYVLPDPNRIGKKNLDWDVAISHLTSALLQIKQNPGLYIIGWNTQCSLNADLFVKANGNIKTIQDLTDKKVAIVHNGVLSPTNLKFLIGLNLGNPQVYETKDSMKALSALQNNQVQAVVAESVSHKPGTNRDPYNSGLIGNVAPEKYELMKLQSSNDNAPCRVIMANKNAKSEAVQIFLKSIGLGPNVETGFELFQGFKFVKNSEFLEVLKKFDWEKIDTLKARVIPLQ